MKLFIVLLLASFIDLDIKAWSYDEETEWGGVCNVGKLQSPINIMSQDAVIDTKQHVIRGPLQFRGYKNVRVEALNNGHTLKWKNVLADTAPVLSGGPLKGNYSFLQFHLHWLSEHAIDGRKYPLEIHMVHAKSGLTVEEAVERPDGLVVIGIFALITSAKGAESALQEIMPVVPYLQHESSNTRHFDIDLSRIFSPEPQSYYTYHGSLTTPNCQEAVTWIVMDKPIYITDEQYKAFYNVNISSVYNYRSLQPTNRVVYRSVASCASLLAPSLAATLFNLMTCLSSTLNTGVNKGYCAILNVRNKLFGDNARLCSKYN